MRQTPYLSLFVLLFSFGFAKNQKLPVAKNLIFFIGDGMGPAAITGARIYQGGSQHRLHMEDMSFTAFSRTFSSNNYVTDSAASATALASGVKTYNGSIGMSDPKLSPNKKSERLQTILDIAKQEGKWLGIISTARVTHATPASFYAHVPDRDMELQIADQVKDSSLRLLLGGGRQFFFPKNWKDPETSKPGKRTDGKDLTRELVNKGWTYVQSKRELDQVEINNHTRLLGLFEHSHMQFELERKEDKLGEPSLKEMVQAAIKLLSKNKKGYFLIVEAGRIDHAAHANVPKHLFGDVLALDEAVDEARKHKKDTLIVVTADHETGGLSLNGYQSRALVVGEKLLGNDEGNQYSLVSFATGPGGNNSSKAQEDRPTRKAAHYIGDYSAHSAVDVPILADGPGAQFFHGYMNNIEIPRLMLKAFGWKFKSPVNERNYQALK